MKTNFLKDRKGRSIIALAFAAIIPVTFTRCGLYAPGPYVPPTIYYFDDDTDSQQDTVPAADNDTTNTDKLPIDQDELR